MSIASLLVVGLGSILAMIVLVSATAPPAKSDTVSIRPAFVGTWKGPITDTVSSQSRYRGVYSFHQPRGSNIIGTSRYPAFDCGGNLLLRRAEGKTIYFKEVITTTPSTCFNMYYKATLFGSQLRKLDLLGKGKAMSPEWVLWGTLSKGLRQ